MQLYKKQKNVLYEVFLLEWIPHLTTVFENTTYDVSKATDISKQHSGQEESRILILSVTWIERSNGKHFAEGT